MTAKKKATKKPKELKKPKEPSILRALIPEETLEHLESYYRMPVKSPKKQKHPELWEAVGELKGWLLKKNDPYGFRDIAWSEIRKALDHCVLQNERSAFDTLAEAWLKGEVKKTLTAGKPSSKNASTGDPWGKDQAEKDRSLATMIEGLIPLPLTEKPNSQGKLDIIDAIRTIQKKEGRAPSRAEIESQLKQWATRRGLRGKTTVTLSKNKISDYIIEMDLAELLSGNALRKKLHNLF
jgi:hypothetical protein